MTKRVSRPGGARSAPQARVPRRRRSLSTRPPPTETGELVAVAISARDQEQQHVVGKVGDRRQGRLQFHEGTESRHERGVIGADLGVIRIERYIACPSIITNVVSPSTRVRSIRRFLTKLVKSSSTLSRISTGASVMLRAVLTFAGRTTTYSFMATPVFLRV